MTSKPNYRRATVLAYKLLLRLEAVHLPLDPITMARKIPNVRTMTYQEYAVFSGTNLRDLRSVSEHGYTIRRPDGRSVILYDAAQDPDSIRFTVAHELGHLMLEHKGESEVNEKEANCFARNLICPLPYAEALNIAIPIAYFTLFCVSPRMAEVVYHSKDMDRANIPPSLYRATQKMFQAAVDEDNRRALDETKIPRPRQKCYNSEKNHGIISNRIV